MDILVCIKQVPGTSNVEVDPVTGVLKRDGVESKLNPYDLYALEQAFTLKELYGGTVRTVTMGPPQAKAAVMESVYMGADSGVVISDRQTVIADKTSDNAADRVFRVRFNLKAGTYDKKKVYRLVIANEIDVEEIEFHIDIAFADDFGFDL